MNVSIIGTGYVGLVTGACLAEMGNAVTCQDADAVKIGRLNAGEVGLPESGLAPMVARNVEAGRLTFTANLQAAARGQQVILVAVGTPRGATGAADTSEVYAVARDLVPLLKGETCVLGVKSTVPVGTGEAIRALFEADPANGVKVTSVPEFLREGSAVRDFLNPDRIVVGTSSAEARRVIEHLFGPLGAPFVFTANSAAEMVKLAANAYLAMRVSYANTVRNLCGALGAESAEVLRGLGLDRRIGTRYLQPGLGYGGPCLPKDVDALIALAKGANVNVDLMQSVQGVNERQADVFCELVRGRFDGRTAGARLCALGLSFKAGTGDLRGSRALKVVSQLAAEGAVLSGYDPGVPFGAAAGVPVTVCRSAYEAAESTGAVLLLTPWPEFARLDLARLRDAMATPLWIDAHRFADRSILEQAEFTYVSL